MPILIVVGNPKDWPLDLPGIEVVSSREYLTKPIYSERRNLKVFNLAREYKYQTAGYYVSLLAEARGHRPLPSTSTIVDLQSPSIVRMVSEDVEKLVQKNLAPLKSDDFELSIYFGRNMAMRYERLARKLFALFPAPMLRAKFVRKEEKWLLRSIHAISGNAISPQHHDFVVDAARKYFAKKISIASGKPTPRRFDLAILVYPAENPPPSNGKAIRRFVRAGEAAGFGVELITKDDFGRLAEFDALFIRETTRVNHHTFRFARKAEAEQLVVIDDPTSILRCTNKVYLAELLRAHRVPIPLTLAIHRDNFDSLAAEMRYPCVIKQPDSYFSQGVYKVDSAAAFTDEVKRLLEKSDLLVAQEFMPTEFDWRVGVFDREVIFVCKYYMAKKHWQIVKETADHDHDYGKVETIPVSEAPRHVIDVALRAANLIGAGLYGVDLKEVGGKCYIIEVNDNPNIDGGFEDKILGKELYAKIIDVFVKRIERQIELGAGAKPAPPRAASET